MAPVTKGKLHRSPSNRPPRPKLSLEGVELCALSAERLLRDSLTVSEPTALALCELAIEEACKGLMMSFLILFKEDEEEDESANEIPILPDLEPDELTLLNAFFEENREYLEGLDRELAAAFKGHPPKLRFLEFSLKYDRITLSLLKKQGRMDSLSGIVTGPVFKPGENSQPPGIEGLEKFLDAVRLDQLQELQTIKNEALYVSLYGDGSLASPALGPPVLPWIRQLAILSAAGLRLSLVIRVRWRPNRVR